MVERDQRYGKQDTNGNIQKDVWGVFGGMGPRASAEFVKSIYEDYAGTTEQEAPIIVLLSDPTMPDRTQALLSGGDRELLRRFTVGLDQLVYLGATRMVVCCVTMHHLIEQLSSDMRDRIVSLVDVLFENILKSKCKHLLICTEGARRLRIFERHNAWPAAKDRIVLLSDEDQSTVHQIIYSIKVSEKNIRPTQVIDSLLMKYNVDSYIAGCTELHIIAKEHEVLRERARHTFCIDPLNDIAKMIRHDEPVANCIGDACDGWSSGAQLQDSTKR